MYYITDKDECPKCQWEGCQNDARSQVFNEDGTQSIFTCLFHRGVVLVNLETTGKLRIGKTSPGNDARPRPTTNPLKPRPVKERPVSEPLDWEEKAARQADAQAQPIEAPELDQPEMDVIVPDIPTPRKPRP